VPEKIDRVRPNPPRRPGRIARKVAVLLGAVAMLLPAASAQAALTGGASAMPETTVPPPTEGAAPEHSGTAGETGAALVAAARTRIGSVYSWGSTGPRAFDCSGLVTWAARRAHISVPRVSFAQFKAGTPVKAGEIQAGDLVFFDTAGPGASDVGIATGPSAEISATVSRGVVEHPIFDSYWGPHFVGARRIEG
jgi:cell wall-associated NlpC family hydrolase